MLTLLVGAGFSGGVPAVIAVPLLVAAVVGVFWRVRNALRRRSERSVPPS